MVTCAGMVRKYRSLLLRSANIYSLPVLSVIVNACAPSAAFSATDDLAAPMLILVSPQ